MIGRPLRCSPPVDLLSALFGVGGTPAFEILTAVPVTYGLALRKFVFVCRLANENDTQAFLQSSTLMLGSPSLARVSTQ